jgi:hypothetical protein
MAGRSGKIQMSNDAQMGKDASRPARLENGNMAKAIAVVSDLIFSSKILGTARALGITARTVTSAAALDKELAAGSVGLVMVDMGLAGNDAPASLQRAVDHASAPTTVAFYPHVQSELKDAAKRAGAHYVLPRSKFNEDLPNLLGRHCGREVGSDSSGFANADWSAGSGADTMEDSRVEGT